MLGEIPFIRHSVGSGVSKSVTDGGALVFFHIFISWGELSYGFDLEVLGETQMYRSARKTRWRASIIASRGRPPRSRMSIGPPESPLAREDDVVAKTPLAVGPF